MTVTDTFRAYTIVAGDNAFGDGEEFAIGYDTPRHGRLYDFFRLGSVEGVAARYNADPDKEIARAIEYGHELYWANKRSTVISAHPQDHRTVRAIEFGDTITFKGKTFRVEPAANNNVKLVELA